MRQLLRFLGAPLMILALIFITGFSNSMPALAQANEPIVAGVDRLDLSTDEIVTLTVVVNAASLIFHCLNFQTWTAFPSSATARRHR